ncbi:MAG: serine protein kinase RIO [Candidatus Bathyarchaeia archaeon]
MSSDKRHWKQLRRKLTHRERRLDWEQRHLIKDRTSERAVFEDVFDKSTLMTVYKLMNTGVIENLFGVVKTGKESRIYRGETPQGDEVALKIYLTVSAEFRKNMLTYIQGDPRFTHIRRDSHRLIDLWAQKEFKNLKKAYEVGVKVPQPFTVEHNVLVMRFIGRDGVSAPLLREVELPHPAEVYRNLLNYVRVLYEKAELVHGDLSEFNVLMFEGEPWIIDMSQSVVRTHPQAERFLLRDLTNLARFFNRLGVKTELPEATLKTFLT